VAEAAKASVDTELLQGAHFSYTWRCAHTPEGFFKFTLYTDEIHRCRFAAGNHIHIGRREQRPVAPENFSGETFYPVANDGRPDFFARRNSQTRHIPPVFPPDNKKTSNGHFVGGAKKSNKISTFP
jgi:hypothetical protein